MIKVEIMIPALDNSFDFMIDENATVNAVLEEICEIMCKKTKSRMNTSPAAFALASMDNQKILVPNCTLLQNGIREGSKLILV